MKYTEDKKKEVVNYIERIVNYIKEELYLSHVTIKYELMKWSTEASDSDFQVPFSINYNNTYKQALLRIYPPSISAYYEKDGAVKIFDALVHECCHILTTDLREKALDRHSSYMNISKADEQLVEMLAIILRPTFKKNYNNLIDSYALKPTKSTKAKKTIKKLINKKTKRN